MRLMGDGETQLESMTQLLGVSSSEHQRMYSSTGFVFLCCSAQAGENHAMKLFQALESKLLEEDLRRHQKAQAKFDLR